MASVRQKLYDDDKVERSPELRLPTVAVPVRAALVGRPELLDAHVFIADVPRSGRTQLIDDVVALFESDGAFVPLRCDTGVRLYGKDALACVAVRRRTPTTLPEVEGGDEQSEVFTLFDHQHRVELELLSGMRLEGSLMDSSPSNRSRAVDHLNRAGRFVRLWSAEEHYLVHKAQILQVTEMTWTPEPGA